MIYIKDMDMPVDCLACRISCKHESYLVTGRPKDCPLEEAKDGDLISRADAIEAVKRTKPVVRSTERNWGKMIAEQHSKELVKALNALPSAEAVQGWIPCSERLPSESGDYLATIPLDADETYTEVLTFHKGRFYEDDDEWGATYHDDVLAWMPLPTPYKGGDDE